jgi:MFS family permease
MKLRNLQLMKGQMTKTKRISLIVTFAAVAAILDSIPGIPQFESGVWSSWIFLVVPLFGFILGPIDGFISILIGVLVGHSIFSRGMYEFLFTIGAPVGAMIAGMLFKQKRSIPIIFFTVLLTSYFLTPISWKLPLWGMWDVYLAFIVLLIVTIIAFNKSRLLISTFVGLEADILFRIFLLIPLQTYHLFYGLTPEVLKMWWVAGAIITPIQVGIAILFTMIIYPPIQKVVKRTRANGILSANIDST